MARTQFSATTYNSKYSKAVVSHLVNRLGAIYDAMYQEAAKIGASTHFSDPNKPFYLKDFPTAESKLDALLKTVAAKVESLITDGIDSAWELSGEKNAAMVADLAQRYKWSKERVAQLSRRDLEAVDTFKARTVNGMNLSERVWNFVKHDKQLLEMALELGLAEGKSAARMSRDVREYLQEPSKLFRRVRDKDGVLRLSKAAAAYHPGTGVYRSSYKNAMRLTITETNMAYRTADFGAWGNMPFVTGYTIKLSASHPVDDMCDYLQGDYPKGFKFTGWHPHCLCYAVAKLATREELREYSRLTDQEAAGYKFSGQVKEMPTQYDSWLKANTERILRAKSMPYFIRDNYVDGDPSKALLYTLAPEPKVQREPRTQAERDAIQARWDARKEAWQSNYLDAQNALDIARSYSSTMDLSQLEDLMRREQMLQVGPAVEAIKKQLDKIRKEAAKLQDLIPDAEKLLGRYDIERLKEEHKQIKNGFDKIKALPLVQQELALEFFVAQAATPLQKEAFQRRLDVVRVDVKLEAMAPRLTALQAAAGTTTSNALKNAAERAKTALAARDVELAEKLITEAETVRGLADRMDALRKRANSSKIASWLDQADELLEQGKLLQATQLIADGEVLQAKYEHDNMVKKQKAQAKKERKAAEAEAKKKAAELAAKKKKEVDLSKLDYDGLKAELGSELPELLAKYEESISREQYTSVEYRRKRKDIERKLKDFFESQDFGHWEHIDIMDDNILDRGFLNNLESAKVGGTVKRGGYNDWRRNWGHFGYGLQDDMYRDVPRSEWLQDSAYYRCGIPMSKDKKWAFENQSNTEGGYGTVQVRFRKDKVITTFTLVNSLGNRCLPSLTSAPSVVSLDKEYMGGVDNAKYTSSGQIKGTSEDYYIEIQYLPKKGGRLGPEHVESIVLPYHPDRIKFKTAKTEAQKARVWERWYEYGVDVYYYDAVKEDVVLWRKGKPQETPEEMAARLAAEREARLAKVAQRHKERDAALKKQGKTSTSRAQELIELRTKENQQMRAKTEQFFVESAGELNADFSLDSMKQKLAAGNIRGAYVASEQMRKDMAAMKLREAAIKDLIPNVKELHQEFTMTELEDAHAAIRKKLEALERRSDGDQFKYLKKLQFEVNWLQDPSNQKHRTWKVAQEAYRRAANEKFQQLLGAPLKRLRDYKTNSSSIKNLLAEAEAQIERQEYSEASATLARAEELRLEEIAARETKATQALDELGAVLGVKFPKSAYTKARKDAALWYDDANDVQASFDAVDKVMSKYAEDVWARLSEEERHVAFLYTAGSKYINEPFFQLYSSVKTSPKDGSIRLPSRDINTLSGIIEKCKPLENDMWVQHTEDTRAVMARWGIDLTRISSGKYDKYIGVEGVNEGFFSTSCAKYSLFSRPDFMNGSKNVVLSVYLPKGTKGLYCEPFAQWGDGKLYSDTITTRYGNDGYKWSGQSRQEQGHHAGDQVEFLLQRGAKLKITDIQYKDGRYWVECELTEQMGSGKFVDKSGSDKMAKMHGAK